MNRYVAIGLILLRMVSLCLAQETKPANRLAKESSPYLLQHAHNPVNWYPWGDEALDRAKRENKLIFLSVGYAACHWCHVMERESFMDDEIARFMNEHFICIKVDREERPDIDQLYMTAVQIMTGSGGWPMSVFLSPEAKPIFGGTYFPARDGDRANQTGFLTVLQRASQLWQTQRTGLLTQADHVTEAIREAMSLGDSQLSPGDPENSALMLTRALADNTASRLAEQFDDKYGGFNYSEANPLRPKFPEASNLLFLLERCKRTTASQEQRDSARTMLLTSLDGMLAGGIYDHLGGGFHRYSTDRYWRVPHFEKMLYDNGQLATVYAKAFELTGNEEYRTVTEGTCDFVLRELLAPGGAFFASLDADSEGEEGKYYRWSVEQLSEASQRVPGYRLLAEVLGLSAVPNFDREYFVPQPGRTLTKIAESRGEAFSLLNEQLKTSRRAMFEIRRLRPPLGTDAKILTAWNGLMIAGLADAGRIFNRSDYIQAAERAAEFVLKEMRLGDGRLLRSFANGEAKLDGYLDDYAFLVYGLLHLHQATGGERWQLAAIELTEAQVKLFRDPATGGFFYTSDEHTQLIVRTKDPVDSAIPSGNSVTAENLAYLTFNAKRTEFNESLRKLLLSSVPLVRKSPNASPMMSAQIDRWLDHW